MTHGNDIHDHGNGKVVNGFEGLGAFPQNDRQRQKPRQLRCHPFF
jgi:hypothetical protein